SPLVTLGLFQSDPPSGRNPKWPLPKEWICTRSDPTSWSAQRPPSGASPLPHFERCTQVNCGRGLAPDGGLKSAAKTPDAFLPTSQNARLALRHSALQSCQTHNPLPPS
ncbi:hypothetical protein EUX57_14960, partial [Pseudomonas orientalis]